MLKHPQPGTKPAATEPPARDPGKSPVPVESVLYTEKLKTEDGLQSRQPMATLNAKLLSGERLYRSLFESIDDGFCIIEKIEGQAGELLDFRFIEANPAVLAQSGVSNIVGKTMREVIPGETEEWFLTYDAVLRTGKSIRFERALVARERMLELYAFRVEDETLQRVAIIFKDITERKRAESASRANEEFHRSIIQSSPDCIKILDLEGNLLSMHCGQELLGIKDIRPFLNKPWIDLWKDKDIWAARAAVDKAAAGGTGQFIGFFRTLLGESKWWDVAISPILDSNNQPTRLLAVSRDVTVDRRAEINLVWLASATLEFMRLTSAEEMMRIVGMNLGGHLDLSHCAFAEINAAANLVAVSHQWHRDDVPALVGAYQIADCVTENFLQAAFTGKVIVVRDTAKDLRTGSEQFAALKITSFVCVPLIQNGQWRFTLSLCKSEAYDWREDEIELIREITARIWTRLERLQAEVTLQESQRFLRSSLDALSGHVAVLDESGKILEVNAAWRRFADENQFSGPDYGVGASYIQNFDQKFSQGSKVPAYVDGINDVIAGRQAYFEMEYHCHSPTHQRWFIMRVTRFQSPGPVRLVIVHDNCTVRKIAVDALRTSEERYRYLFDSIDEGYCVIEMIYDEHGKPVDYRFLELNPAFEKQTGLHAATGKRMRELTPDHEDYWFEIYGKVALTGESVRFVNQAKALGDRWLDVYACRVGGPDSGKVAIVFNDITQRKQSEKALLQSLARFQSQADELGRFNRVAVGRELRMIELKEEINTLCQRQGEAARYTLDFELSEKKSHA